MSRVGADSRARPPAPAPAASMPDEDDLARHFIAALQAAAARDRAAGARLTARDRALASVGGRSAAAASPDHRRHAIAAPVDDLAATIPGERHDATPKPQ